MIRLGGERGQSIVESTVCMLLICLVLFGLLQVFHLYVAKLIYGYSAFTAARSGAVGFADYLVERSARVASIGAAGNMTAPEGLANTAGPISQLGFERVRVPEYIQGKQHLNYEHWPHIYGQIPVYNSEESHTRLGCDYPLELPMREAFTKEDSVDVHGEASVANYSFDYLN